MATTLVTPPTVEVVTLAEAKAHCRIDIDDDDGLIAGYILDGRNYVETETRRALMTQTWDLTLDYAWPKERIDGSWRKRIVLPRPPVQSVTSISYIDGAGATQILAANQYKLAKADTGEWFIEPAYGVSWPTVRNEMAAISVRFVAGYGSNPGDVPEALRHAILFGVELSYDRDPSMRETLERARDSRMFPFRVFY